MATGDIDDMSARLQPLIPHNWFTAGLAPLRDAALRGAAASLAFIFSVLAYVRGQTRIATSTDGFLDLVSADYFGGGLPRSPGQNDASFLARIKANLLRERATRASLVSVLTQITGRAPLVIETRRPADCGAYSAPNSGYGVAGFYGSVSIPFQGFVIAYRPPGTGLPNVGGYGSSVAAYGVPSQAEYASLSFVDGVTDADIYAAIDSVRPVANIVWASIQSDPARAPSHIGTDFVVGSSSLF